MGSSWTTNIVTYGLGDLGIRFAARYLDSPELCFLTTRVPFAGFHELWYPPAGTRIIYGVGSVPDVPGHPHFPYGKNVVPDEPV